MRRKSAPSGPRSPTTSVAVAPSGYTALRAAALRSNLSTWSHGAALGSLGTFSKVLQMPRFPPFFLGALLPLLLTLDPCAAIAADHAVRNTQEFTAALRAARPGDRILLAPGEYRGGIDHRGLRGEKNAPILIAAADPEKPPVIRASGSGLHLISPAYVELRHLIIEGASGNGLNIDDGAGAPAQHLLLSHITVRDIGPKGNSDGVKLSGVDDFVIEHCRIETWGASGSGIDMVGCHRGVIQDCVFADARSDVANAMQTKGGSEEILIRRCLFTNYGGRGVNCGGSTGLDYFRPKDAAYEAKNITIEDCIFQQGGAAIAFVGVDGAAVHHNTIYLPQRWAFRILQENTHPRFARCRNVHIERNLIAFNASNVSTAINIGGNTEPETFTFVENVWSCLDRPDAARRIVRLPVEEKAGVFDFTPRFQDVEKGDLTLLDPAPHDAGARKTSP